MQEITDHKNEIREYIKKKPIDDEEKTRVHSNAFGDVLAAKTWEDIDAFISKRLQFVHDNIWGMYYVQ